MLLRAGVKVNNYFYIDINPVAREVAQFRIRNLTATYPHLFPPSSWENAFDLPQDLTQVSALHLAETLPIEPAQWVLTAGWPCQDFSSAGLGRIGKRAALLENVIGILTGLRKLQPTFPVAYLLENVPMQDNFRYAHIRSPVYEEIVSKLGEPLVFDAAQVGSSAHRVRNYWTNLGPQASLQRLFSNIEVPHAALSSILGPLRHPMPVRSDEKVRERFHVNEPGKTRQILPTLVSYRQSRAFRPGKPGSIYDERVGYTEPAAIEREQMMGCTPSTTAALGMTDPMRMELLGQAMDMNALSAIWSLAEKFALSSRSNPVMVATGCHDCPAGCPECAVHLLNLCPA